MISARRDNGDGFAQARTEFKRLNLDWNAEPNAPDVNVAVHDEDVWLRFHPNPYIYSDYADVDYLTLQFSRCSRYRFTPVNDEAWFLGNCRFSKLAPDWGEFYEVEGDFLETADTTPWCDGPSVDPAAKNFLFYFRDEAFECSADQWRLGQGSPSHLQFQRRTDDVH